jgi:hypothetical protein
MNQQLFSIDEAGRVLGGISPWTLRKHIAAANVKATRIGRRVFLTAEEVERIRRDGLPSLGPRFVAHSKTAGDGFPNQIPGEGK